MSEELSASRMMPYVEARRLFVEWCACLQASIPVEFGSIGCPGISDIDIGIVFKEGANPNIYNMQEHLERFPKEVEELMNGGTLMFFPESAFKDILYVDDIHVRCLAGNVDVKNISNEDRSLVELAQIIEWLPERIVKIHLELKNKECNKKKIVGCFYSLCYSLDKIQRHTEIDKDIDDFIEQVHDLRRKWFSMKDVDTNKKLEAVSSKYIDIASKAIRKINPILTNHFELGEEGQWYNLYGNVNLVASKDIEISVSESGDNTYVNVPPAFLCTYFEYSRYNSCLGNVIARHVGKQTTDVKISEKMKGILNHRMNVCSQLFDFVKALGSKKGLYKFGWYLNE